MSHEYFVAGKDIVDSLRIEGSMALPYQDEKIKFATEQIHQQFLGTYRDFLFVHLADYLTGIENRIFIMDTPEFEMFHYEWNKTRKDKTGYYYPEVNATMFYEGYIVGFDNPMKIWKILSNEAQDDAVSRFGSKEIAMSAVAWSGVVGTIAHEISHKYQNPFLPVTFNECGAYFYQRKIIQDLHFSYAILNLEEKRINFYSQILNKYGDNVHKLVFGQIKFDCDVASQILSEFSPDVIEDLFPDKMGL